MMRTLWAVFRPRATYRKICAQSAARSAPGFSKARNSSFTEEELWTQEPGLALRAGAKPRQGRSQVHQKYSFIPS
jgi:hypothetical protein